MTPRSHQALGPGAEFDRVRAVWQRLGRRATDSGDDCAFVPFGGTTLAVSTDLCVEGVHFRSGWMDAESIGYRCTAAALSDLAAVGAEPVGVMVSVGVSPEQPDGLIPDLMAGVGRVADAFGAKVWGGDTTRSDRLVMDVAVFGRIDGEPVRRRGAETGDRLLVTGRLGGPGLALSAWNEGREPPAWARERFVAPVPRIPEGQWLRGHGAHAMIDLSDGLVADAGHLGAASECAAVIDLDPLPAGTDVSAREAAVSGEEYELLVAFGDVDLGALTVDFERTFGLPLTPVGRMVEGRGVHVVAAGEPVSDLAGFQHFT